MAYARGPLGGKRFRNYQNASSRDGAFYGEPLEFPNFNSRRGTKYASARYSRGGSVHSGTHSDLRYSSNFNVDDYGNMSSLPQRGSARATNVRGGQRRPIASSTTRGSSRQRQRAMDMDMSGDIFPSAETKGADGSRVENVFCCRNWIHHGSCRYLPDCRYRHELRLVVRMPDAHKKGIYSMCSVNIVPDEANRRALGIEPGTSVVELYTASQDKTVKRWMLYPCKASSQMMTQNSSAEETSRDPALTLRLASTIEFDSACLSVFFAHGCLVCGLGSGIVKVYERESGHEITLTGHTSEVHCVRFIDHVLITGDWGGSLRLWTPDPVQKSFVQTAAVEIGQPITCFTEVTLPCPEFSSTAAPQRHLWVGCSGSIIVLDLSTLAIVRTVKIPATRSDNKQDRHRFSAASRSVAPVVMGLLAVDQHVVCSFLSGKIQVYSAIDGSEVVLGASGVNPGREFDGVAGRSGPRVTSATNRRQLCAMAGSSSEDGPVLICGRSHGIISIFTLPTLCERSVVKYGHDHDVRAVHNIGGTPSYFSTGGFDGSLCVWHWEKPVNPQ